MVVVVTNKAYSNMRVCLDIAEALNAKCILGRYNPSNIKDTVIINGTLDEWFIRLVKAHRHNDQLWYPVLEGGIRDEYFKDTIIEWYKRVEPYIVVPSRYVKMKIEELDLYVDKVIPHGIHFKPLLDNKRRNYPFLYISGYLKRKFPPYCEPILKKYGRCLTLVTSMNNPYRRYAGRVMRIIYDHGGLTDNDILDLYHKHIYYMNLSDSEGFGLTPLEAMSQGCIPIVLDIQPLNEYCNDNICYMVKPNGSIWNEPFGKLFIEHHGYDPEEYILTIEYAMHDKSYTDRQRKGVEESKKYWFKKVYMGFLDLLENLP